MINKQPERTEAYFVLISHHLALQEYVQAVQVAELLYHRILSFNTFTEK
jgi:hypothetical protein